jgi:hypothetical protein
MASTRRNFLFNSAATMSAAGLAQAQAPTGARTLILGFDESSFKQTLAARELLRGLTQLGKGGEVRLAGRDERPYPNGMAFELRVDRGVSRNPEGYRVSSEVSRVVFAGASEQALLYAVFDFLERNGAFFGIDGDSYPEVLPTSLVLPEQGRPWEAEPRFKTRGLLPWPDFLNCITVYNEEDFRAYFENMLRMRFNTFGMHVYTGAEQWAESYLSFEFGGAGHLAFLDSSASHRWGYLPQRTSHYAFGADQLYDGETFGSDATRLARDPWECAEKTRKLLQTGLAYAKKLGISVGIGFEPYQIPDEIWRALPPEVKPAVKPPRSFTGATFDMESVVARRLLETRIANLLESYPDVDHVWLWEDEGMNWESRKSGIPLSTTPFLQSYDFLQRNAPKKRMVLSGWGGVARHFDYFHKQLPQDVIFSCLSDSLGWDPIHKVFGQLEGRERWPIPWLEDDPAMWLPQFHVNRFERDMNLAEQYGCQGLIGIHWRHRIVDPTAGYQARFSWDKKLTPAAYYQAYAKTQASAGNADRLAAVLNDADKNGKLLSTSSGEMKDGHVVQHEYTGDYDEAFKYWVEYGPSPKVVESQRDIEGALKELVRSARSASEKEKLQYLSGHVEFAVPYTDCWISAQRIHKALKEAAELKKSGNRDAAREKVRTEAAPVWLQMAPDVRKSMLAFQRIVATRNDLGTLASMQNKFVRIALHRLRLSMLEYLGELPASIEQTFAEVTKPDIDAPVRVVVPTRPSMLGKLEKQRVVIVVGGNEPVKTVTLETRVRGSATWSATSAKLMGRRTYEAIVGPFPVAAQIAEYRVTAVTSKSKAVAPLAGAYLVTIA